jgi:hypothetical protein
LHGMPTQRMLPIVLGLLFGLWLLLALWVLG